MPRSEPGLLVMYFYMVPQVGLEPTRISPLASKTSVATITPPGQKLAEGNGIEPLIAESKSAVIPFN